MHERRFFLKIFHVSMCNHVNFFLTFALPKSGRVFVALLFEMLPV